MDTVIIHKRLGLVDAVGNLFYRSAREFFALLVHAPDAFLERLIAIALQQMQHAPLAGTNRRQLRAHVAHGPLRHADIGLDNRGKLGVFFAGPKDFHERELQPFGKNIAGDAAELPAHVLPVRHRG